MKVVDLKMLWNFVVYNLLIWSCLELQRRNLHSVQYGYRRMWECSEVVREATRESEVVGLNPAGRRVCRDFVRKMTRLATWWRVGGWPGVVPLKVFLFIFSFFRTHLKNLSASGCVKTPTSTEVSVLAGAPPTSTNPFHPLAQIVYGIVHYS
jgi:hypothetical protein